MEKMSLFFLLFSVKLLVSVYSNPCENLIGKIVSQCNENKERNSKLILEHNY
jgi:hypothetical protein